MSDDDETYDPAAFGGRGGIRLSGAIRHAPGPLPVGEPVRGLWQTARAPYVPASVERLVPRTIDGQEVTSMIVVTGPVTDEQREALHAHLASEAGLTTTRELPGDEK